MPLHLCLWLQTEIAQTGSLVRTEQCGRAGTEKFTQAERQSADHHFGDATGISALALVFPGFVHIDAKKCTYYADIT